MQTSDPRSAEALVPAARTSPASPSPLQSEADVVRRIGSRVSRRFQTMASQNTSAHKTKQPVRLAFAERTAARRFASGSRQSETRHSIHTQLVVQRRPRFAVLRFGSEALHANKPAQMLVCGPECELPRQTSEVLLERLGLGGVLCSAASNECRRAPAALTGQSRAEATLRASPSLARSLCTVQRDLPSAQPIMPCCTVATYNALLLSRNL